MMVVVDHGYPGGIRG